MTLIVMLSLPVLYVTGSLRKSVSTIRVNGRAFVLYFLIGAVLSSMPIIFVIPGISVNMGGLFLCVAPAVYLALKKDCGYRFLLASLLCVLLAALSYFMFMTFTIPIIRPLTGIAVALMALAMLRHEAAAKAPVLAGLYGICESTMSLLTAQSYTLRLFDVTELAILCFFLCFAASSAAVHIKDMKAEKAKEPHETEHPSPGPQIPEPKFPGIEFPEPEFPKPEFPTPEFNAVTEPEAAIKQAMLSTSEPKPNES